MITMNVPISSNVFSYSDIVLAIDTSDSVDGSDLIEAIDFIYNVTKWLTIGSQDIQVAVVTYASDVTEQFDLDDYTTNTTLLDAIQNLKSRLKTGGGTYTFDALTYVKTTSFIAMRGARNNSMKAVLVMTDGQSTNYPLTVSTADSLRSDLNAEVFAIGIGKDSKRNMEIQGIANDPDSYYVYYVDSFDYLCSVVPSLVPKLGKCLLNSLYYASVFLIQKSMRLLYSKNLRVSLVPKLHLSLIQKTT
jgi:uncharacterized protein YegL